MNSVPTHRMFLRVYPNTFNPVMGGFIILKDHKPQGPYKEVLFKGHVFPLITATVSGTATGTYWRVKYFREGDKIDERVYAGVADLTALAPLMAADSPGMGDIAYNAGKSVVEISDPINSELVCTIERGTTAFPAPAIVNSSKADEPVSRPEPSRTKSEEAPPKEQTIEEMQEDVEDIWPDTDEEDDTEDTEEDDSKEDKPKKKKRTTKKQKKSEE